MTDTKFDLAAIRAACEGHTPEPWEVEEMPDGGFETSVCGAIKARWQGRENNHLMRLETRANAALIEKAPALLAEVERLTKERGELVGALRRCLCLGPYLPGESVILDEARALLARLGGEA